MKTATPRKTSSRNQHLRSYNDFLIIPFSLNSTMLVKNNIHLMHGPEGNS